MADWTCDICGEGNTKYDSCCDGGERHRKALRGLPHLKKRYEQAVEDMDAAMERCAKLRRKLLDAYCEVPEHEPMPETLVGSSEDYSV